MLIKARIDRGGRHFTLSWTLDKRFSWTWEIYIRTASLFLLVWLIVLKYLSCDIYTLTPLFSSTRSKLYRLETTWLINGETSHYFTSYSKCMENVPPRYPQELPNSGYEFQKSAFRLITIMIYSSQRAVVLFMFPVIHFLYFNFHSYLIHH